MIDPESLISVVIPAYNEEQAMPQVLDGIVRVMDGLGAPYEVLVVDDGSTDGTCAICERYEAVTVLRHDRNRGTGAARSTGVRRARASRIVMIDADGTYPVEAIPEMLRTLETCDMVIGARDREMGTMRLLRSAAKESIRALASYLTQTDIPDLNSGLRVFRRDVVLEFLPILPETHSWVSTITMALLSSGYSVRWTPITYHKRIGKSTFHPIRDTYNYISLVVRAIMYFNPLRVFLPVTLALGLVGIGKALHDVIRYRFHFAPATVMLVLTAVQVGAMGLLADLIVKRGALRR
jgi:glycosyltransferase involved in cell wall biosynthesis